MNAFDRHRPLIENGQREADDQPMKVEPTTPKERQGPVDSTKGSGKREWTMSAFDRHRARVERGQRDEDDRKWAKTMGRFERVRRTAAGDGDEQDEEDPAGDLYGEKDGV